MPRGYPTKRVHIVERAADIPPKTKGFFFEPAAIQDVLKDVPISALIAALAARGGSTAFVAKALELVLRKSSDYNQAGMVNQSEAAAAVADRDNYFPFGTHSYVQMLHVKHQRVLSLVAKIDAGGEANFEGLADTLLDVINYASFFGERLSRPGQELIK